jgi:HlyD family secretion protein
LREQSVPKQQIHEAFRRAVNLAHKSQRAYLVDTVRNSPRQSIKRKMALRFAACGLLALLGLVLFRATKPATQRVERSTIWTERVRRGELLRQVPVQGTLVPEHVQWLSATTAARVAQIAVRPGAEVLPDTVVLVLENTELELAALEAERQAASASALLVQLDVRTQLEQKLQESTLVAMRTERNDAERRALVATKLAPEGLISGIDFQEAQNRAGGLNTRVVSEESRHEAILRGRARQLAAQQNEIRRLQEIATFRRRQLASLEIRAGIRGIVQDIPLEQGQWVATGALLAKVAEPEHLKAEVRVAEGNAKDVRIGLAVRFEGASGTIRGHIARIDPAVVSGNVRLEVALDDGALPPGARAAQAVSGQVEIETLKDTLCVVRPAGAQDNATVNVFRLREGRNEASRVSFRSGHGSNRELEILTGLSPGDEIIISDSSPWENLDHIQIH